MSYNIAITTMLNDMKFVYLIIAFIYQTSACSLNAGITKANYRRQNQTPPPPLPPALQPAGMTHPVTEGGAEGGNPWDQGTGAGGGAGNEANRFVVQTTTTTIKRRTTPRRVSLEEECDYLAYYCLKAYKTGRICGRTLYYNYQNFKNYCMLDYVNCMERYEVWQIAHMGDCFEIEVLKEYQHYEYHDDFFLDQTYVIQE